MTGAAAGIEPQQATFSVPMVDAPWVGGTRAVIETSDERTPDGDAVARVRLNGPAAPDERQSETNSLILSSLPDRPTDKADWRVRSVSFWVKPVVVSDQPVTFVVRRGYGESIALDTSAWRRVETCAWGNSPLYFSEVKQIALRTALPPEGTVFLVGPLQFRLDERPLRWLAANSNPFEVNGLWWLKENEGAYIRLPRRVASVNAGVWNMAQHPSGARVRFKTDSRTLKLRIDHGKDSFPWPMMSSMAMAGLELYEGPPEQMIFRWVATPASAKQAYDLTVPIVSRGEMKEYTLYLPMYAKLVSLDIGLDPDAVIEPPTPFRCPKPVVFYGTSFVQGGCASRGSMNFPAILGRKLGADIINLGFAGDGRCEPQIADCMAELDAACFVMGPILNDLPLMTKYYPRFVARLRERWPTTPILLMTRLHTVGQSTPYEVNALVQEVHRKMVDSGDRKVWLFDAFALYGDSGFYPTADGVHPTDYGFMTISDALAPILAEVLGLPAATP
jgi:hypothetical protein